MSTSAQKNALKEFRAVTGAAEKAATDALKKSGWNLERAIDAFFNARPGGFGGGAEKKVDAAKLNKVFDKYAGTTDKTKDIMEDEKMAEYLTAIGVDPEAGASLTVAYRLRCKVLGRIMRQEFCDGWAKMGVETIENMKTKTAAITKIMENKVEFKDFYRWLFDFIKDEGDRKTIDTSVAVDFWNLVLKPHFSLLDKWIAFLEKQNLKTVSSDLWTMTYEFARDVKPDLSNYDADGAWPAVIDEFVEYVKEN